MKDVKDIVTCTVDYGKFIFLAEKLGETVAKSYYYSPNEREFVDLNDCVKGDGIPNVERLDDFLEPEVFEEIDLFVFPDIGFNGLQKQLRELGKVVWGAMGVGDLELYRTDFLKQIKSLNLPTTKTETVKGLTNLSVKLRNVENKYIKIDRYRACMETWKWIDFDHSQTKLDSLASRFGPLKDEVVFVIQDKIESEVEIGYDGWSVDGKFPNESFQGYELKNELYLGACLKKENLPAQVLRINNALGPVLKEAGYRNFIATEIRIKDKVPYFIDPTLRMPGLTGDQLPETCENLSEVIWAGANGILIAPKFLAKFVAVGTLHYNNHVQHEWFTLCIPEKVKKWFKLYHYCQDGELYHFIPSIPFECDEAGTVIGMGDTKEFAIKNLKDNLSKIDGEPVSVETDGFNELLEVVKEAEKEGVRFHN